MPYFKGETTEVAAPRVHVLDRRRRSRRLAFQPVEKWSFSTSVRWVSTSGRTRWSCCGFPKLFNLRSDPFERGEQTAGYVDFRVNHAFLVGPAIGYAAMWIQSFKDFPPRSKPGSFNLSQVMDKLSKPSQ